MSPRATTNPLRKLRRLLRAKWKTPAPEQVHELRTASRHYRALLETLQCGAKHNERRALRDLDKIRKRAGRVRDLDVLTAKASTLHLRDEGECQTLLLERLGAKRARQARKLQRLIAQDGSELRRRLKRTSGRIEKTLASSRGNSADAIADVRATACARAAHLADAGRLNRKTLHEFRIDIKALRDVLKVATNGTEPALMGALAAVKDRIGEWHDWQELAALAAATTVPEHRHGCALTRRVRSTTEQQYQMALAGAVRLRRQLRTRAE